MHYLSTRIWSWESNAFGTSSPDMDVDGDGINFWFNRRFPGQFYDTESGLHYNYFRDYEPGTGRYVESDPIGLDGGINTYIYALNNPIQFNDKYGLNSGSAAWVMCAMGGGSNCTGLQLPPPFVPKPPPSCELQCEKKAVQICMITEDSGTVACRFKFIKGIWKVVCKPVVDALVQTSCEYIYKQRCIERDCKCSN